MKLASILKEILIVKHLKFIVSFLAISVTINAFADDEWDKVNLSGSWTVASELNCYSKSPSNLSVWNSHAETPENKKNNKWSSYTAYYSIPSQNANTTYFLALSASNKNNNFASKKYKVYSTSGKEEWVEKGNYWYIKIDYRTKSGATKYWRISYNDDYSGSYSHYNTSSIYIQNNSTNGDWVSGVHEDTRNLIIGWNNNDGMVIMGYNGESSEITINDAASITWITIGLGPSAYIDASLEMVKESDYSKAKPYLEEAASQMQAGNYNGAANTLTRVIDNLNYKKAYLLRGYAYTQLEYFKTALEDFNKAVSYASDKEERETAYYYRGICKLFLDDLSGAVYDLRNAGQQGKVVLNEYDLEAQLARPNTQRNVRKPSNRNMSKPALTK